MNRLTSAWRSLRRDHGPALAVVGSITLYILFGLLLWWGLDRYIQPTTSTEKKDLMQALGLIMAGVAGGVGIYFTWRNLRLTQSSTEENLRLTREGQITERFTRAIDQLGAADDKGNKRLEIRLGGIYALERIANDSPEREYSTIMEILTAYVRENARRPPEGSPALASGSSEEDKATTNTANQAPRKPPADIQAILTVLGRRKRAGEADDVVLDLSVTDLRGADLAGAYLKQVDLFNADLKGATFEDANLQYAGLVGANLQEAILIHVDLQVAYPGEADLQGATLHGANLRETILWGADLHRAHLLTQEQINEAHGDDNTKLPDHLQRPAHWSEGSEG